MGLVSAVAGLGSLVAGAFLVWRSVNTPDNPVKALGLAVVGVGLAYLALSLWGVAPEIHTP